MCCYTNLAFSAKVACYGKYYIINNISIAFRTTRSVIYNNHFTSKRYFTVVSTLVINTESTTFNTIAGIVFDCAVSVSVLTIIVIYRTTRALICSSVRLHNAICNRICTITKCKSTAIFSFIGFKITVCYAVCSIFSTYCTTI